MNLPQTQALPATVHSLAQVTRQARTRTGKQIATRIQAGTVQIGMPKPIGARGAIHFEPLTQWMSIEQAIQYLNNYAG